MSLMAQMMTMPLMISSLLTHAERHNGDVEIVSKRVEGDMHRTTWAEVALRSRKLAQALTRLGCTAGDRVGTLAWNGYRHLEVYYGKKLVETLPRLTSTGQQHISYRHLIGTLLRKPGGFREYRYREALFPSLVYRRAWEQLNAWQAPRKADLTYLRILHLAARTLESDVTRILEQLLATNQHWDDREVERRLNLTPAPPPAISRGEVSLAAYDHLLSGGMA